MKSQQLKAVTYLKIGKAGLGNQMFQVAACIGVASKYSGDYMLPHWKFNEYLENPIPTSSFMRFKLWKEYKESSFTYSDIPPIGKRLTLRGYFQSEKYFKHCEKIIREHFTLNEHWNTYIKNKYPVLTGETCSIHVRRGDYLKYPNKHPTQPVSYYEEAVKELYGSNFEGIHFVICSDDIDWCKSNFNFPNMTFVEGEREVIDMFIMSMCQDNVIANSSFSWWSAWLNQKDNKVVAPKMWFGPKITLDTKDLYLDNWIKV